MSLRPEHLEAWGRRLAANEAILKIMVIEELLDIIHDWVEPKQATKIEELYMSLNLDEGKYVFDDFRYAVNEAVAELKEKRLPNRIRWRLKVCLDYLFPPTQPL